MPNVATVTPNHYYMINACNSGQLTQCQPNNKNQANNSVEVPTRHENIYMLRNPLQMCTGLHIPTQLHCNNCTAHQTSNYNAKCVAHLYHINSTNKGKNTCRSAPMSLDLISQFFWNKQTTSHVVQ